MTAEQLRNSILQEAISGRLVPQDPNDEPAAVVSTVPEDEIPFEIPASWRWIRMKDCAAIIGGFAFPSASIKGEKGVRVIRISDISEKGFVNKSVVRYNGHENLEKFKIIPQDILIAMTGGTVGKSLFVQQMGEDMLLNQRVAIIRNNGQFAPYIDIVVKSPHIKSFINDKKNSTNDNISMGDINSFLVPLPPIAEQKRIVAKLEELLPIVEQYGKAQKELDELNAALPARLRQSILQEAISGRLVPQDPNDEPASVLLERMQNDKRKVIPIQDEEMPYEIPGSWEWVNLGSIVSIITGKKDANFGSEDGTYDFFTCSNTPIKCKSYSYDGDYLIMPGNGANIGKVIHYKGKFEAYQRTYLLQGYGNFDLDYLKYHLMCNWKEYNQDKLYGSAIPYIKLGNLMSYPVALPPLAEQQRIVAKIEELFEQIDKMK